MIHFWKIRQCKDIEAKVLDRGLISLSDYFFLTHFSRPGIGGEERDLVVKISLRRRRKKRKKGKLYA